MMPVPVLHHHHVNNNNREEVEINAKCGGTGVFLPSKEIASTSQMKNLKPEENTTTGGGDAVVSTRMRKKSKLQHPSASILASFCFIYELSSL